MKKAAYATVGFLVVVVALLLALPSLVDLNDYKQEIVKQAAEITGRELTLDGDIGLSVLPAPTLSLAGVSLSNAEGGREPFLATLGELEVRVALWPLLSGQVQVERVTLVDPVIWLELLPSGQPNWEFEATPEQGASPEIGTEGSDGSGIGFRFDRIDVENGRITYIDPAGELEETIDAINVRVSAESLEGPFNVSGTIGVRKIAVALETSIGQLKSAAATPLRVTATVADPQVALRFNGTVSPAKAQASGALEFSGDSLLKLLALLLPEHSQELSRVSALSNQFGAKARVVADANGAEVNDIEIRLGSATANGAVNVLLGDAKRFDIALSVSPLQLEEWLSQPESDVPGKPESATDSGEARSSGSRAEFQLPSDVSGSVTVGIEALTYNDGVVSQVEFSANLADGAVTITRAAALLPGGSSLDLSGGMHPVDGVPQFEGQIKARSDNLRGLLGWLGVAVEGVSSNRLRTLDLASKIRATPKLVQMYGVDLRLDSSRLSGGLAYAFRERPAFSVDFVIDQLNLDAYLPKKTGVTAARSEPAKGEEQSSDGAQQGSLIPPQVAAVLEGIDTNTKISIGTLTYNDLAVKGLLVDVGLLGGELTIRNLDIQNLGGGSFTFKGNARGFSTRPSVTADLRVSAPDVADLARLAGLDLPVPPDRLGGIEIAGKVSGSADEVRLDLSIGAIGGDLGLKGTVDTLAPRPRLDLAFNLKNKSAANLFRLFDATVAEGGALRTGAVDASGTVMGATDNLSVDLSARIGDTEIGVAGNVSIGDAVTYNVALSAQHPDAAGFVREFGIDYQPAAVNLGALKFSADVAGTAGAAKITDLKGNFGPASAAGNISINLDQSRPRITGDLQTSEILIDLFLPRVEAPSAQSGGRDRKAGTSRWSSNPLDLSFLRTVDVALDVAARGIIYGTYTFAEPKLSLTVQDGALSIEPLTGKLFGGEVVLRGRLQEAEIPSANLSLRVSGGDLQQAIADTVGVDAVAGRVDIEGSVSTRGRSERELVSALNGSGSFAASDGTVTGIDLKSLSDRLKRLNEIPDYLALLQTTLNRGETRFTSLGGSVNIENGVIRTVDLGGELEAARLSGQAVVDLPRWLIDLRSELRLTEHPGAPPLGLEVHGSLDAPKRDVKTRQIEQYLARRVGGQLLQKVLPKEARGIGALLLGGQRESQSSATPAPSGQGEGEQEQRPEALTPETLLKGLFKRLGR